MAAPHERRIHILVADDDPIDQESLAREVRKQHLPYSLESARDFSEAEQLIRTRRFDIALLDHNLGDGFGIDLLPLASGTPCVIVTGAGNEEVAQQALERGAWDFIVKDGAGDYLRTLHLRVAAVLARTREARRLADLEELAAAVSHDLRTPARSVLTWSEMLLRRRSELDDDQQQEHLERIRDSALRMHDLFDGFLAYSQADNRAPHVERFELAELIEDVLGELAPSIRDARVEARGLPAISAERARIKEVLRHAIHNALIHGHERAENLSLSVACEEYAGSWRVTVCDNGVGVESQYFEKVFQPFARLRPAIEDGGSGMGLSICRRIVENHGGRIWIEASPEGGVALCFTLPMIDDQAAARADSTIDPPYQSEAPSEQKAPVVARRRL